ncbi:MAG: hypothetical protein RL757_1755 [Bacteroidota bacterium]|jgi:uncharacterized protein (DUF58 family)
METSELIKKVRKIEIKTRGLSANVFSGEYHSAFKGRGMSFSEVRAYQYGDDVRNIDWNVTARSTQPFVKVFEEERELCVMLVVDVSKSSYFGTIGQFKNEMMTEIAATLAFSAIQNNDKVGVIFFSDRIESYIPPKKGRSHILRIIRNLLNFQPESNGTNVARALEYLGNVQKKRAICFLISDFQTANYDAAVQISARKHDLVGIKINDPRDADLPSVGLFRALDSETGRRIWVDTDNQETRKTYAEFYKKQEDFFHQTFVRCGADTIGIKTNQNFADALLKFFKQRRK